MRKMIDLSKLTKTEKAIVEFLSNEYESLDKTVTSGKCEKIVQHYRDEAGYIMANVENILKWKELHTDTVVSSEKLAGLINFLKKEYNHSTDTIDPKTTSEATYIQGIQNEAKFFASFICTILGIDSDLIEEKEEQEEEEEEQE